VIFETACDFMIFLGLANLSPIKLKELFNQKPFSHENVVLKTEDAQCYFCVHITDSFATVTLPKNMS